MNATNPNRAMTMLEIPGYVLRYLCLGSADMEDAMKATMTTANVAVNLRIPRHSSRTGRRQQLQREGGGQQRGPSMRSLP